MSQFGIHYPKVILNTAQRQKFATTKINDFNNTWDANKDGSLQTSEVVKPGWGWTAANWNKNVTKFDKNADKKLNFNESIDMWSFYDTDKNGSLSPTEIIAYQNPAAPENASSSFPSEGEVKSLLQSSLAQSSGQNKIMNFPLSVALLKGDKVQFYSFGDTDGNLSNGIQKPDQNTLFPLASESKVLTSSLLSVMDQKGIVDLTAPAETYLPGVDLPEFEGKEITLEDLATHTSGLPASSAPNASTEELFNLTENATLQHAPGDVYEYNNVGYGLLGEALGHAYAKSTGKTYEPEKSFEAALKELVLNPLGMSNTKTTLTDEEKSKLAVGYAQNQPVDNENVQPFDASGGVYSTPEDLIKFLQANIEAHNKQEQGLPLTELETALVNTTTPILGGIHGEMGSDKIGLGWYQQGTSHLKQGSVPGFKNILEFDNADDTGIVLLSGNSNFQPAELIQSLLAQKNNWA